MSKSEESQKPSSYYFGGISRSIWNRTIEVWKDGDQEPLAQLSAEAVVELLDERNLYRSLLSEVKRAIEAGNLFPTNKEPGREATLALVAKIRTAV